MQELTILHTNTCNEGINIHRYMHCVSMCKYSEMLQHQLAKWNNILCQLCYRKYVWQSRVEIKHYSVAYLDRITVFEAL